MFFASFWDLNIFFYNAYVPLTLAFKGECRNFLYFDHKPSWNWDWWGIVRKRFFYLKKSKKIQFLFISGLKFHSVWGSPTTKYPSILVSQTIKFYSASRFPTTKSHSIWVSPTTNLVGPGLAGRIGLMSSGRGPANGVKFGCQPD